MNKRLRMFDFVTVKVSGSGQAGNLCLSDSEDGHKSLVVKVKVNHAGRVNGNYRFYRPDYVQQDVLTFIEPGRPPKPVLVRHDEACDPLGRIVGARYFDTSFRWSDTLPALRNTVFYDSSARKLDVFSSAELIYNKLQRKYRTYDGLGYIELDLRITNPDAVEKVLRGEYLTVSAGFSTDSFICSICHTDWAKDGRCEHKPGSTVDGKLCFMVTGHQVFEEVSFVNFPADPFAAVTSVEAARAMKDSMAMRAFLMGSEPNSWPHTLLHMADSVAAVDDGKCPPEFDEIEECDQWYFANADDNYVELANELVDCIHNGLIDKAQASFGVLDGVLSASQRAKLKANQFCGPNRTFPVPDCAHVTAARRLIGRAKVSESTKKRILACVNRKAKAMGCDSKKDSSNELLEIFTGDIQVITSEEAKTMQMKDWIDFIEGPNFTRKDAFDLFGKLASGEVDGKESVWTALHLRVQKSGWLEDSASWTREEIEAQAAGVQEILSGLDAKAAADYLARLRDAALQFGIEIPAAVERKADAEEGSSESEKKENEPDEHEKAEMARREEFVALIAKLEELVEMAELEEDRPRLVHILQVLVNKLDSEMYLELLINQLSANGYDAVKKEDRAAELKRLKGLEDDCERLKGMVVALKETNSALVATRKRDMAAQIVYLMALSGEQGFDALDPDGLQSEIEIRAGRQLASLQDQLSDLQRKLRLSPAGEERHKDDKPEAGRMEDNAEHPKPEEKPSAVPAVPVLLADVADLRKRAALEFYRRLKQGGGGKN